MRLASELGERIGSM